MAQKIPNITLNNNNTIPQVGLGTWKAQPGEVEKSVKTAIRLGYRHIDCAAVYLNEKEVGKAINEALKENNLKREDLFITSKLWNTCHGNVREAAQKTLNDLGLDYLDLYLMHFPIAFQFTNLDYDPVIPKKEDGEIIWGDTPIHKTWKYMEQLVDDGLVRNIGVSNFPIINIRDLLSYARIQPVMNQIEVHPLFSRRDLIHYCQKWGIQVTAYSPLGSGKEGPMQDPNVHKIAERHGKTPAQVLLRWNLQHHVIVIPKSIKEHRIQENFNLFDFELSNEEMKQIDGLNQDLRTCDTMEYWGFPVYV
eukprot:gb/GECH01010904.1/.p1 GENE.gb/GECH01010904.1/~~gb/GECH01010904.1/.p1  ORF type:complete len:307 (+),score=97.34 gb/GECH01010904.1/:1-921(+)